MPKAIKIIGYKGFTKDNSCMGHKFEVGVEYVIDGKLVMCKNGFHFCKHPTHVLEYYYPASSVYGLVECEDILADDYTNKLVCRKIKVLQFFESFGDAITDYSNRFNINESTDISNTGPYSSVSNAGPYSSSSNTGLYSSASNTGDSSSVSNTGYHSSASNTGDYSSASNTGSCSSASNTGEFGIAAVFGYGSKASASIGGAVVLTERSIHGDILSVKAFKIDGKKYKPNTWYKLIKGKVVECV